MPLSRRLRRWGANSSHPTERVALSVTGGRSAPITRSSRSATYAHKGRCGRSRETADDRSPIADSPSARSTKTKPYNSMPWPRSM